MTRVKSGKSSKPATTKSKASTAADQPSDSSPVDESRQPTMEPATAARPRLGEIRSKLESAVGQVVLLMMQAPHYRHHSLADLSDLVLEPLLRDRIAIAHARLEPDNDEPPAAVGAAIWASVDDATDSKIREQIKAGAFPVRLSREEWNSGDRLWLLDIIAGNSKSATAVLMNFRAIAGDRPVQLHPLVARSIDLELLAKLKVEK